MARLVEPTMTDRRRTLETLATEGTRPLRVLVADDHEDSVLSLALVLESLGFEVRTATDGQAALDVAGAYRPDAILLDIGMPSLSGYDICRRIRAENGWGGRVFMIAMTGRGHDDDRRKSFAAGFDRHLVKPIDPATLTDLLGRPQVSLS